ncbi:MAG: hypothetical protein R3F21_23690 [Myxococcota bacterium]
MRTRHPTRARLVGLLVLFLLAGCGTKLSAPELDARLARVSQTATPRQAIRRVFPIHAQTKMEAWVLQTEAKSTPESSPLSLELADGFRLGRLRRIDYTVGGPFPELSDRLVLNGLLLNESGALPGLRIILVSPAEPTAELRQAAKARRVRIEHRPLD